MVLVLAPWAGAYLVAAARVGRSAAPRCVSTGRASAGEFRISGALSSSFKPRERPMLGLGECSPCSERFKERVLETWRRIRLEFTVEVRLGSRPWL